MPDPTIHSKAPAVVDLEPGTYWWCRCGRSAKQPFCDGSHAETGFEPMQFKVETKGRVALCQCKHTASEPRCDGSHRRV